MDESIEKMIGHIMPIAYGIIVFIVVIGMAQLILKGKYKELPFFIVICSVAIAIVAAPLTFKNIGEKIIKIVMAFIDMFLGGF
ncbi:MAG: hypothetical protein ABF289_18035 [Clostridiales bacterium]